MKVSQVMNKDFISIEKSALVGEAASLMAKHKVNGLPVMDGQKVVGMITESDIVQMSIPGILQTLGQVPEIPGIEKYFDRIEELSEKRVEDIVSTFGAITVEKDAELGNAIAMMVAKGIKKLPVLENDEMVGTITYSDIINLMAKKFEEK